MSNHHVNVCGTAYFRVHIISNIIYSILIILVVLILPVRYCALLNWESFLHVGLVSLVFFNYSCVAHTFFLNGIKKYMTKFSFTDPLSSTFFSLSLYKSVSALMCQ